MRSWPASLPDYLWPDEMLAAHSPMKRAMLAAVFHITHWLGRVIGLFDGRRDRVLVIRTDGMGDAILFEPALRSLARTISPRKVHLWAPRLTCELLRHFPGVERLMPIPRGFKSGNVEYYGSFAWRIQIGFALGKWTFSKVIYPAHSPEPLGNWLMASARTSEQWICDGDTIHQFEPQRQSAHAHATRIIPRRAGDVHELSANETIAREWDDRPSAGQPMVHLTQELLARADAQLEAWKVEMRRLGGLEIVGVVPAASMSINSYPRDRWVAALGRLWKQRRAVPVLLGGPENQRIANELANLLRTEHVPCLRLFMKSGILEMAAIISRLDGVLSMDTGLAHLAVAQHVPTVVLVGGGNPDRFFPWPAAAHHVALNVATPCAGCNNRCTQPEAICITQIAPDDIANAYARLRTRSVSLHLYLTPKVAYQKAG